MTQQSIGAYLRHGQTPFFRLPAVMDEGTRPTAYANADVVLLGVPFDGGTTYQPGARFGPYHVRRVSALVQPYHATHRIDVFAALRVIDGGNLPVPPFSLAAMRELVQAEVGAIVDAGAAPFLVGGDHSLTLPSLRALAAKHGPLAIVHIDAHFDTSSPELWGEAFHHGTPLRNAIEEGLVVRDGLFQIGIRGPWKADDDAACSTRSGARIVTSDDLEAHGTATVANEIRDRFATLPVYVTLDIDAVDPAFAPGTGTPVPGGLSSRELLRLLRGLAGLRIVGMDLVEIAPALDHADITCLLGAYALFEGLALRACAPR